MSEPKVYDKLEWHLSSSSFPPNLDGKQAGVYGAFFFAWLANNHFLSDECEEDWENVIDRVRMQGVSPAQAFMLIGGVLASDLLNEEGNAFATYCFDSESIDYYAVFERLFTPRFPTPYDVPDTWESYNAIAAAIHLVYEVWRK